MSERILGAILIVLGFAIIGFGMSTGFWIDDLGLATSLALLLGMAGGLIVFLGFGAMTDL